MARTEARLSVDIWNDDDFLALTPNAQRMFMFLISQRDLAHDGVLALRERRWSKSARGMNLDQVHADLAELAAGRFVVIDEDHEELLVRSFLRRDKVYRQPNVLRAAADHLEVVESPTIRAAIADELRRIQATGELKNDTVKIVAEMLTAIGNPSPNPSGNPPERHPGTPPEGVAEEASSNGRAARKVPAATPENESGQTDVPAGDEGSRKGYPKGSGMPTAGAPGERGDVETVGEVQGLPDSPYPGPHSPPLAALDGGASDTADDGDPHQPPALFAVPDMPPDTSSADPPVNAGRLTRELVDACKARKIKLPDRIVKRYAGAFKGFLDQGFDAEMIRDAVNAMLRDRQISQPSYLDRYLVQQQTGPGAPPQQARTRGDTRDYHGHQLSDRTIARLEDRKRFEAMDAAADRAAIGGSA